MGRLQDRVALVTGGAKGLGRHYCMALASEGAKVVIADIADPTETVGALNDANGSGTALGVIADISEEAQVSSLVAAGIERFGALDVLVNNAALFSTLPVMRIHEITTELW